MTQKYAKIIDETHVEFPPYNKGNIINYYLNEELLLHDGYLPFHEVERPQTNRRYVITYQKQDNVINEILTYLETQEEADKRELENARQLKLAENDQLANIHLVHEIKIPVTPDKIECIFIYNDKTERNLNSATLMLMSGMIQTKKWTDEQGITVYITLDDISTIGQMFTLYADKLWELWGLYKGQIEACTTIAEIEAIELDYNINPEELVVEQESA